MYPAHLVVWAHYAKAAVHGTAIARGGGEVVNGLSSVNPVNWREPFLSLKSSTGLAVQFRQLDGTRYYARPKVELPGSDTQSLFGQLKCLLSCMNGTFELPLMVISREIPKMPMISFFVFRKGNLVVWTHVSWPSGHVSFSSFSKAGTRPSYQGPLIAERFRVFRSEVVLIGSSDEFAGV